jgi:hypothetical protein
MFLTGLLAARFIKAATAPESPRDSKRSRRR